MQIKPAWIRFTGKKAAALSEGSAVDINQPEQDIYITQGPAAWTVAVRCTPLSDTAGAHDLSLDFTLAGGPAHHSALGVKFELNPWSTENYVVMPAAVYNGNRFRVHEIPYPPLLRKKKDLSVSPETMITSVPRLNTGPGESAIHITTADLACPGVGIFDPRTNTGRWILTIQNNHLGDYGIRLVESEDRSRATLCITSPCMRTKRQAMCGQVPSDDQPGDFTPGDTVIFTLQVHSFPCASPAELLRYFLGIRKNLNPASRVETIPFSAAFAIEEDKQNRENWIEDFSFYAVGTRHDLLCELWQLGWVGGLMTTLPLLSAGSDLSRRRAERNLDHILTNSRAGSGLLYGMGDGRSWFGEGFWEPHPHNMHLIRKNADALLFLMRQFDLLEKQGQKVPSAWKQAAAGIADAFAALWKKYGQFGQFVDIKTGDILVGGSTSASTAPGGLALAAKYFGKEAYLKTACESGQYFYANFVKKGYTTGGPGEILQNPDSESAFGVLESFVTLYEVTGQAEWLTAAEDAAALCATWTVSYDYQYPESCEFARLGIRTTGSVFANTQNKHSAPGICTLSGQSLLKLYRATGKTLYLDLLADIAHNLPQYLSRADRPIGELAPGWINERVNMSDWEGRDMVGNVLNNSTWAEVSLLLTAVEVPGLYVRPDTGFFRVFDNICAEKTALNGEGLTLKLHNPTNFNAKIRVLSETADDLKIPLNMDFLLNHSVIELQAGATLTVTFGAKSKTPVVTDSSSRPAKSSLKS